MVNSKGAASIFQAFLPAMRLQGSGKLVAMSSLVGQVPFPFESIYSASKFAIEGMVMSLRYEVAPFGIRVALIEPAQVVEVRSPETRLPHDGEHRDDFILSRELVGMLLARELHSIGLRGSSDRKSVV